MKDPVLVIFMRTDLNMSRGKMAVQAGHAVALTMQDQPELVEEWMDGNQVKIVLAIDSMNELSSVGAMADKNNVPYRYVHDAGKTEVDPSTLTCMAVGIAPRNRLQKITSGWKALK